MKTKYLLPHRFKILGVIIFFPALILGIWQFGGDHSPDWLDINVPAAFSGGFLSSDDGGTDWQLFHMMENNVADEICAVLLLISSMLILFGRERVEDEFTMKLRLESMLWAVMVNAFILLLSILFIYDFLFFNVMVINLFLVFVLFIVRFHWVLMKFRRAAE